MVDVAELLVDIVLMDTVGPDIALVDIVFMDTVGSGVVLVDIVFMDIVGSGVVLVDIVVVDVLAVDVVFVDIVDGSIVGWGVGEGDGTALCNKEYIKQWMIKVTLSWSFGHIDVPADLR